MVRCIEGKCLGFYPINKKGDVIQRSVLNQCAYIDRIGLNSNTGILNWAG